MTAPAEAHTIMGSLTREIERVAVIRERYRVAGDANLHGGAVKVNTAPAVEFMRLALDLAHAAESGDALTIMRAVKHLREFQE